MSTVTTSYSAGEYQHNSAEHACSDSWILPAIRNELEGLPPGTVIADLGCGNGALLSEFRTCSFELHGFDISKSGISQGERAYPEIHFHLADLTTDTSGIDVYGRCDVVVTTEVVEHIFLPRLFISNCYKMLKPNGRLILSTPYHGYLKNLALAITGQMETHFCALWDFGHIKFWSRKTVGTLLQEAGFTIEKFQGVGRLPYLWKTMVICARRG
jgi:2-polyprenyl-3-methyl-5-hydroxy-6-metoxy-1,4-benzoquinol methylase